MKFDTTLWLICLSLLGFALAGYAMLKRLDKAERHQQSSANALTQRLTALELRLRRAMEHNAEQSRRVAMLELQLHQGRVGGAAPKLQPTDGKVTSMTERRHRVLVLARRGMGTEEIAETLGVPKGEVELIISLSSLKAAA